MTQSEYDKRLAELEAEADRRGCCVIAAQPVPPPDGVPERPITQRYDRVPHPLGTHINREKFFLHYG